MNGEFLRGEVYWISVDDSVGSEIQTGRPAVILSGDNKNRSSDTVVVAYVTSSYNPVGHPAHHVRVMVLGNKRLVLCDQVRTVDKTRITRYITTLSKSDMSRVTGSLATVLCIPTSIGDFNSAVDEEKEAFKIELEVMKRMYDKVLTQLVEARVAADVSRLEDEYDYEEEEIEEDVEEEEDIEEEEEPVVEEIVAPPPPPPPRKKEKVNVNTATWQEIVADTGISAKTAHYIVAYRKKNGPYKDVKELLNVDRFGSGCFKLYGDLFTVGDVEPKKVNINTANGPMIVDALGCFASYAGYIVTYRNKNGKYVDLEELKDVPRLPKNFLEKYRDYLVIEEEPTVVFDDCVSEVADETVDEVVTEPEKLNINTATTWDLMAIGFDRDVAARIVSYRKNYKKFGSINDLWLVHGVTGKIMRKLSDKLEV